MSSPRRRFYLDEGDVDPHAVNTTSSSNALVAVPMKKNVSFDLSSHSHNYTDEFTTSCTGEQNYTNDMPLTTNCHYDDIVHELSSSTAMITLNDRLVSYDIPPPYNGPVDDAFLASSSSLHSLVPPPSTSPPYLNYSNSFPIQKQNFSYNNTAYDISDGGIEAFHSFHADFDKYDEDIPFDELPRTKPLTSQPPLSSMGVINNKNIGPPTTADISGPQEDDYDEDDVAEAGVGDASQSTLTYYCGESPFINSNTRRANTLPLHSSNPPTTEDSQKSSSPTSVIIPPSTPQQKQQQTPLRIQPKKQPPSQNHTSASPTSSLPSSTRSSPLVISSGMILVRSSPLSLIFKMWKERYWIYCQPATLLFFKSKHDSRRWLTDFTLVAERRRKLVKLMVEFDTRGVLRRQVVGDEEWIEKGESKGMEAAVEGGRGLLPPQVTHVRGGGGCGAVVTYQVGDVYEKQYKKHGPFLNTFKLEKWTDVGTSIVAKFASRDPSQTKSLRKVIRKCIKKTQKSTSKKKHRRKKKKSTKKKTYGYNTNSESEADESVNSSFSDASYASSYASGMSKSSVGSYWSGCSSAYSDDDDRSHRTPHNRRRRRRRRH